MTKPFLLLQLRPEDAASDDEYRAILRGAKLTSRDVVRVRMDQGFPDDIVLDDYAAVIVGGGPSNVSDSPADKYPYQRLFEPRLRLLIGEIVRRDFPYLGICYGMGILADTLGARVGTEQYGETPGAQTITLTTAGTRDPLLLGLQRSFRAFVGHKEACQHVPAAAVLLAGAIDCPVQMFRSGRNVYATQFHPELDADGLALRIRIYSERGYFATGEAEHLIADGRREEITVPPVILSRFVARYRSSAHDAPARHPDPDSTLAR
ncbi:glutamine amidotransferase [Nocardia sp. NPDC005825]|uniref:glutamine amidotransferase n=1 Tax=unclassified Nocardia TaxID=2637762 RepID=UPI0033C2611F